jgi:hypothetical protein
LQVLLIYKPSLDVVMDRRVGAIISRLPRLSQIADAMLSEIVHGFAVTRSRAGP